MIKWAALMIALVAFGCSDAANTQYLPIGSRCSGTQCGTTPYDCLASGYPFGYCDKPCKTDGDCPADSLCDTVAGGCRRVCSSDASCRVSDGYSCQPIAGGRGVCEPAPSMDGGQP